MKREENGIRKLFLPGFLLISLVRQVFEKPHHPGSHQARNFWRKLEKPRQSLAAAQGHGHVARCSPLRFKGRRRKKKGLAELAEAPFRIPGSVASGYSKWIFYY